MRKNRRDFKQEVIRAPYELELDIPPVDGKPIAVTFRDPSTLTTRSAFQLARTTDPEEQIRLLLSAEDFAAFWSEWADAPIGETNALLEDVLEHYGTNRGKLGR